MTPISAAAARIDISLKFGVPSPPTVSCRCGDRPRVFGTVRIVTDSGSGIDGLIARLADRNRVRSEATVQADVRQLLLTGGLGLAEHDLDAMLEAPVGDRRRIDVEVGFTVIEIKKDLRQAGVVTSAEEQLQGYVVARSTQTGQRYVGMLTDGAEWRACHLAGGALEEVTRFGLDRERPDRVGLLYWLGGSWRPARPFHRPQVRSQRV